MKQFIVFAALFPLMIAFMMQFTLQQNLDYRLELISDTVQDAKESAKAEGYFDEDAVNDLRTNLAVIAGCSENEVVIEVSEDIKYRTGTFNEREMISCRIVVPAGKIIAFPSVLGINDSENIAEYVYEDEFPSERIM